MRANSQVGRWAGWVVNVVLLVGLTEHAASGQPPTVDLKDVLGQKVVTTSLTPLRHEGTLIESDGVARVYIVDQVRPGLVHVHSGGIATWLKPHEVVLFDRAIPYFTERIRRRPSAPLYNKRGLIHQQRREYEAAIADFDKVIERDPNYAVAYCNRGWAKQSKGDLAGAILDFDKAIELDGKLVLAYGNRGTAHQALGDLDQAILDFDRALRLDTKFALCFNNRGWAWYKKGDFEKALADFDKAVGLEPSALFLSNRGLTHQSLGSYAKALADFDQAVETEPRHGLAWANRAMLLMSCPDETIRDVRKAVESAKKACESSEWKEPRFLNILASACAELEDYDAAVKWEEKAIEHAPAELKDQFHDRLERYRAASEASPKRAT